MLDLCEWDHDDYSLKVENLPKAEPKLEPVGVSASTSRGRKPRVPTEPGLFDAGSEA
ncbi:hypothetical protein MF271_21625 (plasmid) [Deinococcus sp. KNUC1210]|uniref:hypothetical protein n=1 Tax=Deinococcus sp. KNUC1210 TaxID=2917691 RepID=UPI001EF1334B|nr:hypothetical protein [Deinococcus sp. KNUC1210]ULH17872.1 hypothetical protein MF271_21625 [Deinococcus sp. KNUC1210]